MSETSIQRARRLAREKRERAGAAAEAAKAEEAKVEEKAEEGFFSAFFGRDDAIDKALIEAQKGKQSTDKANE